jgi:hypothetical protein
MLVDSFSQLKKFGQITEVFARLLIFKLVAGVVLGAFTMAWLWYLFCDFQTELCSASV